MGVLSNLPKWGIDAYKWACCLVLVFAIIHNTLIYFTNKGKVSSVDYRIFHQSLEDKYPAFSLCLENELGNIAPYSIDSLLIRLNSVFKNAAIFHVWSKIEDEWTKTEFVKNGSTKKPPIVTKDNFHFYENPNLPKRFCLTRNNSDAENKMMIKNYDIMIVNKTMLRAHNTNLKLYLHHPGQLMRNYHKQQYELEFSQKSETSTLEVKFQLMYVSVSRLRSDAPTSCMSDVSDEDKVRRNYIKGTLSNIYNIYTLITTGCP